MRSAPLARSQPPGEAPLAVNIGNIGGGGGVRTAFFFLGKTQGKGKVDFFGIVQI